MSDRQSVIGVGAHFSASHRDTVREELHGHSYEVTAWWLSSPAQDAVALQLMLRQALTEFDHRTLPDHLGTMEAIASTVGGLLVGCVGVDVSRPVERLYARWRA